MAKVNYLNQASFYNHNEDCLHTDVPIIIKSENKVFSYKYVYSEADCNCPSSEICYPGKGDDVGFTLIFGNYGETTYTPSNPSEPTVIDTLDLRNIYNASLKVMSVCAGCHFKIFDVTGFTPGSGAGTEVIPGVTEFSGGKAYTLEIRECDKDDENCTAAFCLPCHSVFCASILFQVEFAPCVNGEIRNGEFCINRVPSLDGWIAIPATGGGSVQAVSSYTASDGTIVNPVDGCGLALLKSGNDRVNSVLKQTFEAKQGDILDFYAFFDLSDFPGWPDEAQVIVIKDSNGETLFSETRNAPYISPGWEHFSYTFTKCGTMTFEATVKNVNTPVLPDGYLAIDAVTITHS